MVLHDDIEEIDLLAVDSVEVVLLVKARQGDVRIVHLVDQVVDMETDDVVDAVRVIDIVSRQLLPIDMNPFAVNQGEIIPVGYVGWIGFLWRIRCGKTVVSFPNSL